MVNNNCSKFLISDDYNLPNNNCESIKGAHNTNKFFKLFLNVKLLMFNS
jgi:hypothetical protein